MSKPGSAEQVERQIVVLAQSGHIQGRIDDDKVKALLKELQSESKSFNIRRRQDVELTLLYSDGKDSSLTALPLDTFYDMMFATTHFRVAKDWTHACDMVAELGYVFETLELDCEVTAAATARTVEDGYPRGGIQHVHEHALEAVCGLDFNAAANGTRRDDRVPSISRAQAQSLEDRHGVDYLSPLPGFGHGVVGRPVKSYLDVETGPSEEIPKVDYEGELRYLIAAGHGQVVADEVFPDHVKSYVHGRR